MIDVFCVFDDGLIGLCVILLMIVLADILEALDKWKQRNNLPPDADKKVECLLVINS